MQMEKWGKLWREQRINAVYETGKNFEDFLCIHISNITFSLALHHGWLPDRTELDSMLPEELKEACEKRDALVGKKKQSFELISCVIKYSDRMLGFLGVHGIVNLSNTCCLSVILQAFCHTPIFRDFCLARLHRCDQNYLRFNPDCVMCAFTSMIFDVRLHDLPPRHLKHMFI